MATPPWFKLDVDDFEAATRALSPTAVGILMRLRVQAWRGGGSLPSDEAALARLAGVSAAVLRRVWPTIASRFMVRSKIELIDVDLERQRRVMQDKSDAQRNKANRRWSSDADAYTTALPSMMLLQSQDGCRGDADLRSEIGDLRPETKAPEDPPPLHTSGEIAARARGPNESAEAGVNEGSRSVIVGRIDHKALQRVWTTKARVRGVFVPGLGSAALRIEEYCRDAGRTDIMAVAERAVELLAEYCATRSPGYRPTPDGDALIKHWGRIEPVLDGHGKLEPAAATTAESKQPIISTLDFTRKGKGP